MSTNSPLAPIKMGLIGMSLEDITAGKQGYVKLPIGVRDSTSWGGREWVRVKVIAMEDVRANRDIIVGNDQGEVKEHTPVELSYEKLEGGYQRVGEGYPLPIGGAYAQIEYKQVTAIDTTKLIDGVAGKKLHIMYIDVFNSGGANITVDLRFTTSGDPHFKKTLADKTGFNANLIGCNWQGGEGESLIANLSAAGTVDITVLYHSR